MGYTHYFTQVVANDDDDRRYAEFAAEAKDIITFAVQRGVKLADAMGKDLNGWVVDENRVMFNGYGDEAHETFRFERQTNLGFDFCKTAEKPYDAVVTACLIALKNAYGESVEISSDGEWQTDWQRGARLYQMAVQRSAWSPFTTVSA
jgi:hypothetical protein